MMDAISFLLFPDLSIVRYQTVNRISYHKDKLKKDLLQCYKQNGWNKAGENQV